MRISTFAIAAGLALMGTVALAKTVTYDYDSGTDFSRYKTYAWSGGTELTDELNHARVVRAVDAQLAAKGLTRVEPGDRPEVLVEFNRARPLGSLDGTDYLFIFTRSRYQKYTLVITGPGAGPAVTAGGIFNDVLRLAGV